MQNIKPHRWTVMATFLLIVLGYALMAVEYPVAYILATYEDFVGEWAQVFFFVVAFAFSLRLAIAPSRFRLFFLVLALACFYVFMEEISWGQRIFNIETPEFLQKHNLQQETNLHNLLVGPYSTLTKKAIEWGLAIGLAGFGLIYPLLLIYGSRLAEWVERKGIPAPPLYLWPFFVTAAFLELGPFRFNEAEIAEILVSSGLAIFAMHHWVCHRLPATQQWDPYADTQVSRRVAGHIALIVSGVALLAVGTTYAAYSAPHLRAKMDDRFLNGVEKFADRYRRYDQWDKVIDLYLLLNEREPGRPSVLRNLARSYREIGDQEKFAFYTQQVLELDIARSSADPGNVSKNLSLARTYDLLGERTKSGHHLDLALRNALQRLKANPESAGSAYWLGKVYEQMDDHASALEYYRRAVELNPGKKYIKAYRALAMRTGLDSEELEDE